ncbi:hypothetical protein E2C01_098376 [Portunus trituberculatus]|uniref:Uncharacterized protein n=1 Tax=Portunus trituberculatus TaxID=210409 RepID=A0A5B7JXN2_PORTR|nr:hypothetical protein [Portunus trituberculatus]
MVVAPGTSPRPRLLAGGQVVVVVVAGVQLTTHFLVACHPTLPYLTPWLPSRLLAHSHASHVIPACSHPLFSPSLAPVRLPGNPDSSTRTYRPRGMRA